MPRRGRTLYEDREEPPGLALPPAHGFPEDLLTLMDDQGDIASEAFLQQASKLIARRWREFSRDQSPLSTWNMITRNAETILKIRLATRKGGSGEEERRQLEEFEELLAFLGQPEAESVMEKEETEEDNEC